MSELKQIVGKLPKLTKAERQTLRQALDFFDGGKTKALNKPQITVQDWLLPGIIAELRRRGLEYSGINERRIASMAPDYEKEAAALMASLRQKLIKAKAITTQERLTHAELEGFGRVSARALADYLQNTRSLNLKFMLGNISKLPDALEASYPSYLACGMVGVLVGLKL